ncbi:prenyltransferase [compost metagenome]
MFWLTDLSWGYLLGTAAAALILFYEHWLVKKADMTRIQTAFFTMNGVLSIVIFASSLLDLVVLRQW